MGALQPLLLALQLWAVVCAANTRWHLIKDASQQVADAKQRLKAAGVAVEDKAVMESRLAVMVLHAFNLDVDRLSSDEEEYYNALRCALATLKAHLEPTTPLDIFVFVRPKFLAHGGALLPDCLQKPGIYALPLKEEVFQIPWDILMPVDNWSKGFSHEYRLMGEWRLMWQPEFVRALGYRYFLQYDSDTYITKPAKVNLVQMMKDKGFWVANGNGHSRELTGYLWALPELTAFWLRTRKHPITGPLFNHTRPGNLSGLHTNDKAHSNVEGWSGWDGELPSGNFNIIDIQWWFDPWIQDYVSMVVRTGAHIEHRWNELTTLGMMIHAFVPEARFHDMDGYTEAVPDKVSTDHYRRKGFDLTTDCYNLVVD